MDYNENSFVSQLRQPSRIPSPGRLTEMSTSNTNARANNMLPPPPGQLKRKTLAERAGENPRPAPPPPSQLNTRLANAPVKGATVANLHRQTSFSSSISSKPSSLSSMRHTPNSSFSSSMGLGNRPPSAQSHRSQTAASGRPPPKNVPRGNRPASSSDTYPMKTDAMQTFGNSKSISPFPSNHKRYPSHMTPGKISQESYDNQMNSISEWSSHSNPRKSFRDISISTAFSGLTLEPTKSISLSTVDEAEVPSSPSHIPICSRTPSSSLPPRTPSPSRSRRKTQNLAYLTRESNTKAIVWDQETRIENMENSFIQLQTTMSSTLTESHSLKETIAVYKSRTNELEMTSVKLSNNNENLQKELDITKSSLSSSTAALEEARRHHSHEIDDLQRKQRRDLDEADRNAELKVDEARRDARKIIEDAQCKAEEEARRLGRQHHDEIADLRHQLGNAVEAEKNRRRDELQLLSEQGASTQRRIETELNLKEKALHSMQDDIERSKADLLHERDLNQNLRSRLSEAANNTITLEASMRSMRARIDFLESDCKSQSQAFADLEQKTQDAIKQAAETNEKLRVEETLRRKLHNQVQELKGNIRVFCRVRPSLDSDPANEVARIKFPDDQGDSKEVEILGPEEKSSLGSITTKKNAFAFDRVFTPTSQNAEVFEEISQLVQSALDGYNVCIFCYGQTGAGKTHTMSSEDGMIPRAVRQIYDTAQALEEKGWRYSMEGSFVEVYNENINDLLGKADELDKKKHEIRHDMQKCKTIITDVNTVVLDSPTKVEGILRRAATNRSVAATKANERSSRSHSVFILRLVGENHITGEKSEGTLNLVDLAGSERLSHSGSTGERLKETQNINKSLSCLGDVIGALGQGKEGGHVPYRNSKLTYLLQFSLGGNSKTLMFVMISPLQAHLSETLTSLKFATKVHNTHIGTAKRQTRIRDS